MFKNINKKYNKISLVITAFVFGVMALVPMKISAALGWSTFFRYLKNIVLFAIAWMLKLAVYIAGYVFYYVGKIFNFMFNEGIDITNLNVVNAGWGITRDVLNMFFIIAMLVIAFSTILRIESYQYKVLLPKLIYAALLVNFSRTIATVMIDFSNILMKTLLNLSPGGSIAETYARALFGSGANEISKNINNPAWQSDYLDQVCLALFMMLVLIVAMSLAVFALGMLMLIRGLVLVVLIILSPAAFVLNVLPITKPHAQRWWDEFLKYVFYGPVAAFLIYLSILLTLSIKSEVTVKADKFIMGKNLGSSVNMLTASNITSILVVITFLYMAVLTIQSLSPMAASISVGIAQRAKKLPGQAATWGTRKAVDRVGKGLSRDAAKGKDGIVGGLIARTAGAVGGIAGAMTGSTDRAKKARNYMQGAGNLTRYFDPKTRMAASKAIEEKKDKEIYGKSAAWMRNKKAAIYDRSDKVDHEQKYEDGQIAEAAKAIKDANPALDTNMLMGVATSSKPGSAAQKAAIKLLAETGSMEDIAERIQETTDKTKRGEMMETFFGNKNQDISKVDLELEQAMLTHGLGKERAIREMPNIALARRKKGDHSLGTGTKFNEGTGKMELLKKEEVTVQFGKAFEKMSGDEQMKVKMSSYTDKVYDQATKKYESKMNVDNFDAMIGAGFSGDPGQVRKKMGAKERAFLSSDKAQKKFKGLNSLNTAGKAAKNETIMEAIKGVDRGPEVTPSPEAKTASEPNVVIETESIPITPDNAGSSTSGTIGG